MSDQLPLFQYSGTTLFFERKTRFAGKHRLYKRQTIVVHDEHGPYLMVEALTQKPHMRMDELQGYAMWAYRTRHIRPYGDEFTYGNVSVTYIWRQGTNVPD